MTNNICPHCKNWNVKTCNEAHCDIAGPGEPGSTQNCRLCWLRLGRPNITEPGLLTKGIRFANALIKHVGTGSKVVPDEVRKQRLAICETCDYCDLERRVCKHMECGCRLEIKASWQTQACPVGKWLEYKEENK